MTTGKFLPGIPDIADQDLMDQREESISHFIFLCDVDNHFELMRASFAKRDRREEAMSETEGRSAIDQEKAAAKRAEKLRAKKFREKKPLPSVGDLLAHGAPENEGKPKTWCEIIGYPLALAVVFFISLLIFHHAPHGKSVSHLNPRFEMNARPGQQKPTEAKHDSSEL